MSEPTLPTEEEDTTTPIELGRAQYAADKLCGLLREAVSEIVVAGSIRRGKPTVNDIELVACLREDQTIPVAEHILSRRIQDGVTCWEWEIDPSNPKDGPRYYRLRCRMRDEYVGVNLFAADAAKFGCILMIRTGDADFTRLMVTRGSHGLMPVDMCQKDGYLWRGDDLVPCRTEADYFAAVGVPFVHPSARSVQTALALIEERRAIYR
jgi:DNA polymerase/3'-5' exonuclease PolX